MVKSLKAFVVGLLLMGGMCLSACGQGEDPVKPSAESKEQLTQWEQWDQQIEEAIPKVDDSEEEEVPENVIVMGAIMGDYMGIVKVINAFNQAQSDYQVEVKTYETRDAIFLDLVMGKGCDLLVVSPQNLTILADKRGLEDLSSYLDKSEKVNREDLFDIALEVGTAGGRWVGILPDFTVKAILVEKGYTEDGGWTIEKYLALMDRNPDVPLFKSSDPQNAGGVLIDELHMLTESFVDWEERTCSFESEEFIQTLELVKSYAQRFRKADYNNFAPDIYEMLYQGQIQTETIEIRQSMEHFNDYQDIRDAFLGSYDLAGYPNPEGKVAYSMQGLTQKMYCMNASSAKKDAAWTFLEYMLSDYQESIDGSGSGDDLGFPVRRDILERKLQEEIGAELTEKYMRQNEYSKEMVPQRGRFTEEDKERLLYILDHASPPTVLQGGAFWAILDEELGAFFAGDKTAAKTAEVIQNRVTVYLNE